MADNAQDHTHAATPYKLREARKKGQVAKSNDVGFAAILAAAVVSCFAVSNGIAHRELALVKEAMLELPRSDWSSESICQWLLQWFTGSIAALAPLLCMVAGCVVLANLAQIGPVFSTAPLLPDFTRISPSTGLRRMLSWRTLYDAVRSLLKLGLLSGIAGVALSELLPDLTKLEYVDPHGYGAIVLARLGSLLFKLLIVAVILALIDIVYTRWDFAKKMRMSHRELLDEHKHREGDPRIRKRLRELRKEMLTQARTARKLPEADVLITNPTHIAIAISYKHGEMPAPRLLVKGSGHFAMKMREIANQHRIPVVENRPLARALFKRTKADEYIPEDLYPQVARILLWVYAIRRARNAASTANPAVGATA